MYFIGIDVGTSATKLLLMDEGGGVRSVVSRRYSTAMPQPGWSEQNPDDWWDAVCNGIPELLEGVDASQVTGIGCCGQMHGLVTLDARDRVIRPAILWNDSRSRYQVGCLNRDIGREAIARYTGNVAYVGFTAPKLLWLREEEPEHFSAIRKIMLPKDYITFRLTGEYVTDYSDASGTLLLDVRNRCWSKHMLGLCGLWRAKMPRLCESWEEVGTLLPEVADRLGLPRTVRVCAGAGDNASAAVGAGAVGEGSCNIVLGTAGTILMNMASYHEDKDNKLHCFCNAEGGWNLMGCILTAAGCNEWWMGNVLQTEDYTAEQGAISLAALGQNDVFFLPYLMGERTPHNDPRARGAFVGMRATSTRADLTQAVLEGVAFALRDCACIAREEELDVSSSTICGGGARSRLWLSIISDVLGIPLRITQTEQAPAMGAAMLASVCCGAYGDVAQCARALVHTKGTVEPNREVVSLYNGRYDTWRRIYPALRGVFQEIL
ncbi:MAG: xylulokinase [Olsenella sp.]|jgi:xylulokinase|nr:xylulokinase [Olsenella sp.]